MSQVRFLIWCLSTVAAPSIAMAQVIPPERSLVDGQGVDLVNLSLSLKETDASVGPKDEPLEYIRNYSVATPGMVSTGNSYIRDNYTILLYANTNTPNPSEVNVVSSEGNVAFKCQSNICSPLKANGETLTAAVVGGDGEMEYWYTKRDGTKIHFRNDISNKRSANTSATARADKIYYSNGRILTISWSSVPFTFSPGLTMWVWRLKGVTDNRGYRISLGHYLDSGVNNSNFQDYAQLKSVEAASLNCTSLGPGMCLEKTSATYTRSLAGGVTETTRSTGGVTKYTYDTGGLLTNVTRVNSTDPILSVSYVAPATWFPKFPARVVSSATRQGVTWNYGLSASGGVAQRTATNALSGSMTVVGPETAPDQLTSVTDELGRTTSYEYDVNGRIQRVVAPSGVASSYSYDTRGNIYQTTTAAKVGSGLPNIVVSAGYSASCSNALVCNKPEWTRDAKGFQTDYTYDPAHGGVLSITQPQAPNGIRPQTRFGYSALQAYYSNGTAIVASGQPIYLLTSVSRCQTGSSCTGAADEAKTTIAYGPQVAGVPNNLLPVSVSKAAGDGSLVATTTLAHDLLGNMISVDGPLAGAADTVRYRYDAKRQRIGVVGPDPDGGGARQPTAQRTTYNADGQAMLVETGTVASQSDSDWAGFAAAEAVATAYDINARPVRSELKSGGTAYAVRQTSYDALGRIDCRVQRMNPAAFASLPASACAAGAEGTQGPDRIVKANYDAAGQVTKIQTAYGVSGQQADKVTTAYTNSGQVDYVIEAENNRTDYSYDGFDRLVKTEYPSTSKGANAANASDYEQLTLDANGNVTSRRLRDGQTIGYTYDNLNRVTSYDQPVAGAYWDLTYEYDLLGRLRKATGNGWAINAFTYDALGRLTVEQNYNATTYHAYDVAGRQTRLTWQDGFYADYDYDVTGNVTAIRENGATSGVGVLATYGYDNLGRRTSITRGNGTVTSFGYDVVSRLSSLTQDLAGTAQDLTLGFGYNPASQIASNTRSNDVYAWGGHYNVDRPYTSNGLNQLTAAGSTALGYDGRGNLTSSGSSSYGYTVENRLTTGPGGLVMSYEPVGNRLLTVYNGSTGVDTRFAWSGDQMITEIAAPSGQVLRRYVPGPGVDEPIVWYEGSGTSDRRWLHADERGSVIAVSNGAGTAININRYDEYGIPASGNIGRFGYTGQAWIPELGMWYYKARVYSPTLGRFMQTDPIGYGDGMNWYAYVGSDPINLVDPTGLNSCGWKSEEICVTAKRDSSGGFSSRLNRNSFGKRGSAAAIIPDNIREGAEAASYPEDVEEIVVEAPVSGEQAIIATYIANQNITMYLAQWGVVFGYMGLEVGTGLQVLGIPPRLSGGLVGGATATGAPMGAADALAGAKERLTAYEFRRIVNEMKSNPGKYSSWRVNLFNGIPFDANSDQYSDRY